jgi:hypothetical protein
MLRPAVGLLGIVAVLLLDVAVVHAQGVPTDVMIQDAERKTDDPAWPPQGRFTFSKSFATRYGRWNEVLWTDYGILALVAPTIMFQGGTQGSPDDYTANEQVQVLFGWEFLRETFAGNSAIVMDFLHLGQITDTTGVDFAQSLGISFFTSDSVADLNIFRSLGLRQVFPREILTLYVGHADAADVDAGSRYSQDDTQSFISLPLSSNPTRQMPGAGMGFGLDLRLGERLTLEAHVADALGDGHLKHISRMFRTGEVVVVSALKLENPFPRYGDGVYKLSGYWIDETQSGSSDAAPSGWGLHLQVDQDFGDLGVFAKFGLSQERVGESDRYAAAGVVWTNPFGFDEDWLGFAFAWVHPTAPSSNDEFLIESFWRIQLTPFVQFTPDIQLIFDPSNRPSSNFEAVFTLRARMHF